MKEQGKIIVTLADGQGCIINTARLSQYQAVIALNHSQFIVCPVVCCFGVCLSAVIVFVICCGNESLGHCQFVVSSLVLVRDRAQK